MNTRGVQIGEDAARRLFRMLRWWEHFAPDAKQPSGRRATAAGCLVLKVTTTIAAMSGSTAGQGQGVIATFDPSTSALVAGTGDALDVFSYHEKTFYSGAYVSVYSWQGALWVFDVDKCVNYR